MIKDTTALLRAEQPTALQNILLERSSPLSEDADAASRTLSVSALVEQCHREIQTYHRGEPSNNAYGLELLERAIVQGDQAAWAGVQQCLGEIVRGWLHCHPNREVACYLESEENYVAMAFERFWWATTRQQVVFKTFAGALAYLRASLQGTILDTLRAYSRPKESLCLCQENQGNQESHRWKIRPTAARCGKFCNRCCLTVREQQLAYLLYHCGLKPREIVHFCPQEWSDVQEIYRLRRNILERVLRNADKLRWQLL